MASKRELDLSAFATLHDQDLKVIVVQCPNPLKLIIPSKQITDQGLCYLQALTALQSLNLDECDQITDQRTSIPANHDRFAILELKLLRQNYRPRASLFASLEVFAIFKLILELSIY